MLSRPVKVLFAGWESDTYTLQRNGWQIAADEDMRDCTMQLALSHKGAGIQAITHKVDWQYMRDFAAGQSAAHVIHVSTMHREIRMEMMGRVEMNFNLIDAKPQLRKSEIVTLDDLCHFAKPQQIILPEKTTAELLEEILAKQQPGIEEHYMSLARKGMNTRPAAQIISLAS
jgi:hypothetical protein